MAGHAISLEQRIKISKALKGRTKPEETRRKMSEAKRGRIVNAETRAKLSKTHKGYHNSPDTEFKKGMIPWNKGIPMRPEAKEKMAEKKRGMPSCNKGIPMKEWMPETSNRVRKEKISQNNARHWLGKKRLELTNNPIYREKVKLHLQRLHQNIELETKRLSACREARKKPEYRLKQAERTHLSWQDPQIREKRIKNVLKALAKRPTKPEHRLIKITKKYRLPYKFTGDGSLIIAGLSPDFANFNGAKKLIEIFGVAFHDPKQSFIKVPIRAQEPYRKAIYASLGFDCLVLWDDEMKRLSDEEIANRIGEFTKSRHKPTAQLNLEI